MNNFSVNSCYAVLSACSDKAPLHAFLELVIALVDEKKYTELDPQIMSADFLKKFGIPLPYHPMQAVIQLGIDEKYFEYNSSLKTAHPVWSAIDSGEFMKLLGQKETEYNNLLSGFDQYLQAKYGLHCSKENLSEQVQAFIQRYGLVSKADKAILSKVKNDYLFAEYMIHCNDIGNFAALEYIDQYTTGCAFAEVMTFSVPTSEYKNCKARVFLDTGFIFALLGIGSKDRSQNFQALFQDMVHLGMRPTIFQHTYSEIAGIIDTARNWIGNNEYNPSVASETAYFFVTNNWSYEEATELLGDLKRIITEDYHIAIDDTPYPRTEDIHSKYEADIKQMIIDEYTHNNGKFSAKDKEYTINQDARSLFFTLFFDNGYVARTLPDVKNIFVTTNRTLARVGAKLTAEIVHNTGLYIPISLTDLTWGTLVWANSPAKISPLNRANIIAAAYAAFQPSEEILKKLNQSLIKHQMSGDISPEKCYFLKTNALALRLLSQKTQNDENRYSDQMPFEILKELREEGFQEGLSEKQKEVDRITDEKEAVSFQLLITKQNAIIDALRESLRAKKQLLESEQEKLSLLQQHISSVETTKAKAERKIRQKQHWFESILSLACIVAAVVAFFISKSAKYSWIITAVGAVVPFVGTVLYVWIKLETTSVNAIKWFLESISQTTYAEYGFNQEEYNSSSANKAELCKRIAALEEEINSISSDLKRELSKIDKNSIDISLVEQ